MGDNAGQENLTVFSTMLEAAIEDSQHAAGVASDLDAVPGGASASAAATEPDAKRSRRWSRAIESAQKADQVISRLTQASLELSSTTQSVVNSVAQVVDTRATNMLAAGHAEPSESRSLPQTSSAIRDMSD
eukprot:7384674-Karenia_brevis.AAC.1